VVMGVQVEWLAGGRDGAGCACERVMQEFGAWEIVEWKGKAVKH
jgi:hypothetical protein